MNKPSRPRYDAIVVGAGPNGLAAAIRMVQAGLSTLLIEQADTPGGGARSGPLTMPGFTHDLCSATHPLAVASPYFQSLPLERFGLQWIHSPLALVHPLDDGAVPLQRSLEATARGLGEDARSYAGLLAPILSDFQNFFTEVLQPVLHIPHHPMLLARFGLNALLPAATLARLRFRTPHARALFAGICAHTAAPLTRPATSAIGLVLAATAHAYGWPIPRGGAQAITDALVSYFRFLGGELRLGTSVESLTDLPSSRSIILDLTPRQIVGIAGPRLHDPYRKRLSRFRYGPGVFKMDWALAGPIPWRSADCALSATVHLGGTLEEMIRSEAAPAAHRHPGVSDSPFVLLTQPTLFDPSRAPPGKHVAWAYCHVPAGSREDLSQKIENRIETYAPGFKKLILARHRMGPRELVAHNPNLIDGDISGGSVSLQQILFRPVASWNLFRNPYRTPDPRIFICSSSTPPGPGVHGMGGYHAANEAIRQIHPKMARKQAA